MIYANYYVAKKIALTYPTKSLLRHHAHPKQDNFNDLVEFVNKSKNAKNAKNAKTFKIDCSSNMALQKSLNQCADPNDPLLNKIYRKLATKAMEEAQYFCTGDYNKEREGEGEKESEVYKEV